MFLKTLANKRMYLLFSWNNYQAKGGSRDIVYHGITLEEMIKEVHMLYGYYVAKKTGKFPDFEDVKKVNNLVPIKLEYHYLCESIENMEIYCTDTGRIIKKYRVTYSETPALINVNEEDF